MTKSNQIIWSVTALALASYVAAGGEDVQQCEADADCTDYPFYRCGVETAGICSHKKVFPMEGIEYGGIVVFSIMMALANIAGIGGGGIAIPIVMAFFQFNTKPAIAISSFSIFMTTFARFVMNFKLPHPEKPYSVVIDYNLVAICMPTTLAGA